MQARFIVNTSRILSRRMATAAAVPEGVTQLTLNLTTPHTTLYSKKVVAQVILPGSAGEYGVTAGHSPVISELKPGVVSVVHVGGETEKFFVSGGFALTHPNSTTDVSVPEAFPLSDFDESAVKSGFAEAQRAASASAEGSAAKAVAQIELDTFSSLARALNITL